MSNAELFKKVFGIYAEEFWAYPEEKMLDWLTSNVPDINVGDTIYRQAAIDALGGRPFVWTGGDYEWGCVNQYDLDKLAIETVPSAQPNQQWIPIKTRPMDEEERQYYSEMYGYDVEYEEAVMFDCKMPEDGQEVWVCSKCGNVWQDTCEVDEGIGLEGNGDWLDIVAWMPFEKPKPWKG